MGVNSHVAWGVKGASQRTAVDTGAEKEDNPGQWLLRAKAQRPPGMGPSHWGERLGNGC